MPFNRLEFIAVLHQLLQSRRYQEGLLFCEKAMQQSMDEAVLVEYVRLLLAQKYYDRAYEALSTHTASPYQSINVLGLYEEYYSHTGNITELNLLHENVTRQDFANPIKHYQEHGYCEPCIDRLMQQFAVELRYWSQRQDLLSPLLRKSYNLLKQGLIEECNHILKKVIADAPHNVLSRYLIAERYLLTGKLDKAETAFNSLLAEYPNLAVIHDRLGDISSRQSKYEEAVRHYQYSLNYDNGSVQTWLELVECYGKIGKHSQAAACVQRLKQSGKLDTCSISALENSLDNPTDCPTVKKVFALVVHDGGGSLMPVEFVRTDTPGCQVTGNVSMVLYDSVQVAFNCIKNMVVGRLSSQHGILVNIPQSTSFKDGPSAGIAFGLGIMAVMRDLDIPGKAAFTGEIGLKGEIYPVGGITNKILAAWYSNVKQVWLPAANYPDTRALPDDVRRHMKLVFVKSFSMVVNDIWK